MKWNYKTHEARYADSWMNEYLPKRRSAGSGLATYFVFCLVTQFCRFMCWQKQAAFVSASGALIPYLHLNHCRCCRSQFYYWKSDSAHESLWYPCQQTTNCKSTLSSNNNRLNQYLLLETLVPLRPGNWSVALRTEDLPSASFPEDQFPAELRHVFLPPVDLVYPTVSSQLLSVRFDIWVETHNGIKKSVIFM